MHARTRALSAAGSLLLLAGIGGALARWADGAQGDNLWTNTGYLNLEFGDTGLYYDVSALCKPAVAVGEIEPSFENCSLATGNPVALTLLEVPDDANPDQQTLVLAKGEQFFFLSPGDQVLVAIPVTVELQGQNMLVKLAVTATTDNGVTPISTGTWLVGIRDPDPHDAIAPQFQAKSYGLYQIPNGDGAPGPRLVNALKQAMPLTPGARSTYYFDSQAATETDGAASPAEIGSAEIGSGESGASGEQGVSGESGVRQQTIYAVFEIDYLNLGDGLEPDSNNTELMDRVFEVLGALRAQVTQVTLSPQTRAVAQCGEEPCHAQG